MGHIRELQCDGFHPEPSARFRVLRQAIFPVVVMRPHTIPKDKVQLKVKIQMNAVMHTTNKLSAAMCGLEHCGGGVL